MEYFIFGGAALAAILVLGCGYLWRQAESYHSSPADAISFGKFEAVIAHTFCPRQSRVPQRGQLVAGTAYILAGLLKIPLIFAVGHTVPGEKRTEGEIYADFIRSAFGPANIRILLGKNPEARDTFSETAEAYEIAKRERYQSLLVIALRPHLARAARHWNNLNSENLKIEFLGVYGPARYYLWELLMIFTEYIFPPRSRQREALFRLIGRRK